MSRVELAKIRALNFYKDELTAARRTSALSQLKCVGKACKLYQPEVVRCSNLGGSGTDIDWKCEADLPELLRFGKVEVSCEGWSRPGDPHVLKGSCALEYRLVQVPNALGSGEAASPILGHLERFDLSTLLFWIFWLAFLAFILYRFLSSLWARNVPGGAAGAANSRPRPGTGGGGGSWRGWFPGEHPNSRSAPPPPPYSKNPPQAGQTGAGWTPGFWTGAAAAGAANYLWNRRREQVYRQPVEPVMRPAEWGWERSWNPFGAQPTRRTAHQRPYFDENDRGEGSSNLGSMRTSIGLGGTNVR